jgi:hypothetical protein
MKQILITLTLALTISYGQAQNPSVQKIVVAEVIQTSGYTYLLNKTDNGNQWLATVKIDAKVGEIYYYQDGMEMRDFKSTELDRTFASVIFLQGVISAEELLLGAKANTGPSPHGTPPPPPPSPDTKVETPKGGITIEELMANKASYESKDVLIRGTVVKYNSGIMNKNWIHIQDGTASGAENDLTITTDMEVKVGDVITVFGTIILDKDFGAGYFYKIIMEDASIME